MTADPHTQEPRFSFLLAGAGRVGTALSVLLAHAGHRPVGVWSRSEASALRAERLLGTVITEPPGPDGAEVVIVGASDDAIRDVAARFTPEPGGRRVAIHLAGALGPDALGPGWTSAAALHPVASCPSLEAALERIPRCAWGVTTTEGAEELAASVLAAVSGVGINIAARDRPAWHAAAVTASNGLVALASTARTILDAIGVEEPEVVLRPLLEGTLANVWGERGLDALTGPVVRGEHSTVAAHVAALIELDPQAAADYAAVARMIAAIAQRRGRLSPVQAAAVIAVLGEPG